MTVLEIAVVVALLGWTIVPPQRVRIALGLAMATSLGTIALAAVGRWRWQLVPIAVAAAIVALAALVRSSPRTEDDLGRRTVAIVVVTLVTVGAMAAVALPVPRLTLAEGSGPVGTVAFDLVDPDRTSPSTPADTPRQITVQAWYPAAEDSGDRLPITRDGEAFAAAGAEFLGFPAFALGHLALIRTTALVAAPPSSDGRLPVVLSLHGWGGFRFAQASLLEQLAADGHLVLAIDHTHGAIAAQPVDGPVVPIDQLLLPDDVPPAEYAAASTVLEDLFRGDAAQLMAALRSGDTGVPAAVLDLMDLDRLVVLGHSTGGGAALWACTTEIDCDGVLTYDPWVEPLPPEVAVDVVAAPWLTVLSEEWVGNENDGELRPLVAATADADLVAIEGTEHRDVTVQPLLSPLAPALGLAGELDKELVDEAVLTLTRGFLDRVLDDPAGGETARVPTLPTHVIRP